MPEQGRNQPSQLEQTQLERAFSVRKVSEGLLWMIVAFSCCLSSQFSSV